jgi:hypothetical protein
MKVLPGCNWIYSGAPIVNKHRKSDGRLDAISIQNIYIIAVMQRPNAQN